MRRAVCQIGEPKVGADNVLVPAGDRSFLAPAGEANSTGRLAMWPIAGGRSFRLERAPSCVSLAFPPNRLGSAGYAGGAVLLRSGRLRVRIERTGDPLHGLVLRTKQLAMASDGART